MNKVLQRLLVFFVGLPLVICLVYFNQFHHISLHMLAFIAALLAGRELYNLLKNKFALQARPLVLISTVVPALAGAVCSFLGCSPHFIDYSFIFVLLLCMAYEVLSANSFENSASHLISSSFIVLYAGYLPSFVSRMTFHEHSREFIAFFFLMVCLCDSVAWFSGVLFGKNNKGFIKASPNKSVAGFFGGFAGTMLTGVIAHKLFPEVFTGSIIKILIFGFFVAFVAIIGDLVESVIKRSVEIKDSGSLIPGRGGVLDSIDSILFVAPVYYFGINFLF
ncbi:CDP-archaeol synthase [uncultured Treponema sp.]|uniref:phosphatidate cytidylyltransferase n=1 Tax=uncultured Treponema sp. TaxID=162155 RepID=UPI0025F59712|nr:CDP-archaeol synthase [uncultured Treponema sp.]